ncbi:MAG: type II toxin-antitoxin system PemK/MazF family toxin [Coriobacteriia bacterium]
MVGSQVSRGQVYWANLDPAEGSEQGGRRPVLVVQNDTGNRFARQTIIAVITSNIEVAGYPFGVGLPPEALGRPSAVNCAHVRTIDKRRLSGVPAYKLDAITMERVDAALRVYLGL